MKTLLKYTFATILIAFALNTNANTPPTISPLTEEAYIDDIPFSTENIFDSLCDVNMTQTFDLIEEEFIQDIPFNTEEVIERSSDYASYTFDLEEESYINDIPFSTETLAKL
jgi:hypothetical protein